MSLHDRPTVGEILQAVRAYLTDEVAKTEDRRARFRALIAANVLGVAERELAAAERDAEAEEKALGALGLTAGSADERRRALCADIRAGKYDEPRRFAPALDYAAAMVERKLAVSNPRYLQRWG
jgi:hypothetical protein